MTNPKNADTGSLLERSDAHLQVELRRNIMSDEMNVTEKLSDRIAALEQRVLLGQSARNKANELEWSIEELTIRLTGCREQIKQGDQAQYMLDQISATAERIIAGGDTVSISDTGLTTIETEKIVTAFTTADLPEPHESGEQFEHAPPTEDSQQAVAEAEPADGSGEALSPNGNAEAPQTPQEPSEPHISQYQQMLNHIATLEPTDNFDKDSLSTQLGFVAGSIRKYLYRAETEGHIVKYVVGTDGPNIYRRAVANIKPVEQKDSHDLGGPPSEPVVPAPDIEPKPAREAAIAKPAKEVPEKQLPREVPPLNTRAVVATSLMCEQVLGILIERGRPMSLTMVVGRSKGLKQADAEAALEKLKNQGKILKDPYGFWKVASR